MMREHRARSNRANHHQQNGKDGLHRHCSPAKRSADNELL
jgi:hypothetical protein